MTKERGQKIQKCSLGVVVTLCREPSDKSFSNHLMAQVDLLTNIMVQLRGGTGKVPSDNASSKFQVLWICSSSQAASSIDCISNSSSRVTRAPRARHLKHWLLKSLLAGLAHLDSIANTTK